MPTQKGRRGQNVKTPPALKMLEGRRPGYDSGGRPIKPAPEFKRLPPECPDVLWGDARDEWNRVVPELARLDLIKPVDMASLTSYCLCWQRLCQAQRRIDQDGYYVTSGHGTMVAPWVKVVEAASRELRAWAQQFGLTPAAENNVSSRMANEDGDENPFAATG